MIVDFVRFGEYAFGVHEDEAGYTWEALNGQWSALTRFATVPNAPSRMTGVELSPRRIDAEIVVDAVAEAFPDALDAILGRLDPANPTPRSLIGRDHHGADYQLLAILELRPATDESIDSLFITFVAADPVWRKALPETITATQAIAAAGITVPLVNTGHAPANLTITLRGTALDATSKLRHRRTFTVALSATATDPLVNQWVRVPLGDTTSWTDTGKALADGSNVYVFTADGQEVRRELINFDDTVSYLGLVVTDLGIGITREYVICYGTALATAPLSFLGSTAAKMAAPVFETSFDRRAVSSATTTVLTVAGTPYRTNQWRRGEARMLTGAQAGQVRVIDANTASTITLATALPGAPGAGDAFLIEMSRTDKYIYPLSLDERNDFKRGLWWINRGQNKPSRRSHDAPGSWYPILTLDSNDDTAQMIWSKINVGTVDYFSILDVFYSWDGGGPFAGESEVANGVTYASALPITAWRFGYSRYLPNGMCEVIFGVREAGASDWEPILTDTTHDVVGAALTNVAASADTSTVPTEGTTKHLAAFLVPFNDTEIPPDWRVDTGTATSGSATQLNDNTKAWQSDQFNGGRIRLLSGAGAPQTRTVLDSSPNTVDPSVNFSPPPDGTSRYQVTNKKLVAQLRSLDPWVLFFDASAITVSAVSAEADNYDLAATIRLDGGSPAVGPYERARLGLDGRRVMVAAGQELRIDGTTHSVAVYTTATGVLVRRIAAAVTVQTIDAGGIALFSGDWLRVSPGSHTIYVEWESGNANLGATVITSFVEGVYG